MESCRAGGKNQEKRGAGANSHSGRMETTREAKKPASGLSCATNQPLSHRMLTAAPGREGRKVVSWAWAPGVLSAESSLLALPSSSGSLPLLHRTNVGEARLEKGTFHGHSGGRDGVKGPGVQLSLLCPYGRAVMPCLCLRSLSGCLPREAGTAAAT